MISDADAPLACPACGRAVVVRAAEPKRFEVAFDSVRYDRWWGATCCPYAACAARFVAGSAARPDLSTRAFAFASLTSVLTRLRVGYRRQSYVRLLPIPFIECMSVAFCGVVVGAAVVLVMQKRWHLAPMIGVLFAVALGFATLAVLRALEALSVLRDGRRFRAKLRDQVAHGPYAVSLAEPDPSPYR